SADLQPLIDQLIPEGMPQVKLMQQGQPLKAPVEVRIIGDDLNTLKKLGNKIQTILKQAPGSTLVRSDFREDYYGIDIRLRNEAGRLGFTTESISKMVYTGFAGAPISTMY